MKVGDKVLCINERNNNFAVGRYYDIESINYRSYSVLINKHYFHFGVWKDSFYNFSEYFDTESSIRMKKLKKIGSRL